MAEKTKKKPEVNISGLQNILSLELYDVVMPPSMSYARYVIQERAFPDVSDGLKPIHRRILFAFFSTGLKHNKYRAKSVNGVGRVMPYTPHGDSSVYDAMVRLSNNSVMYRLLDGKGAYSAITTTADAGASRYTETRLSKIAETVVEGANKHTVDMRLTFDEKNSEPKTLSSPFPLILANPNNGIAVGLATTIASYDLQDLYSATESIMKGQEPELMYPSLPTGGIMLKDEAVAKSVMKNGSGSFKLRAKYEIDGRFIYITEIPYTTTVEAVIDKVWDIAGLLADTKKKKKKKLTRQQEIDKGIVLNSIEDINDDSDKDGLKIKIEMKKKANMSPEDFILFLFKKTSLESSLSNNMYMIVDSIPTKLGIKDTLVKWIQSRVKFLVRRAQYDVTILSQEIHLLEGLLSVVDDLDGVVKIIRASSNNEKAIQALMKKKSISEEQAKYITNIRIGNLNKEYIQNKTKHFDDLEEEVSKEKEFILNKRLQAGKLLADFKEIADEFHIPRTTELVDSFESISTAPEDLADDYNVRVFVTSEGYLKKIPLTSLRGNYEIRLKDGDEIVSETETVNSEEVLFFTDQNNVYKKRLYEIDDCKPSALGSFAENIIGLAKDEQLKAIIPLNEETKWILIGYDDGKVAKIDEQSFRTSTNRSCLKGKKLDKIGILWKGLSEDIDLLAVNSVDQAIVLNTEIISPKATRATQGNAFMKLKKDVSVVSYEPTTNLDENFNSDYYRVGSAGIGKKLK